MEPLFDATAFGRLIASEMKRRGLSFRAVEKQAGVDQAIVHRVSTGKPPNVENYLRLMRWLEE